MMHKLPGPNEELSGTQQDAGWSDDQELTVVGGAKFNAGGTSLDGICVSDGVLDRVVRLDPASAVQAARADVCGDGKDASDADGAEPVVLIEIDPIIAGRAIRDRFDVVIRGRALSAGPIEQIKLEIDDLVAGSAFWRKADRTANSVLADGSPGHQCLFRFCLPLQSHNQQDRCRFRVIARTASGVETVEAFEISIDATPQAAVSVISGKTRAGIQSGRSRPDGIIYIEKATMDIDNVLSLQGWAVALDTISATQIFADKIVLPEPGTGKRREDVGKALSVYKNAGRSGFELATKLDAAHSGVERIRVSIVCQDGIEHEATAPIERLQHRDDATLSLLLPPAAPRAFPTANQSASYRLSTGFMLVDGALAGSVLQPSLRAAVAIPEVPSGAKNAVWIAMCGDLAVLSGDGELSVNGWAVSPSGIAQVRVLLDGHDVGLATFGHERPDVAKIHPQIAMARLSGFRFKQKVGASLVGEHNVRVIVRNVRNEEKEWQVSVTATPVLEDAIQARVLSAAAQVTEVGPEQAAEFKFQLDSPTVVNGVAVETVSGRLTINGWVLTHTGISSFQILLDGVSLGDAHFGLARQDVGTTFPEWPNALRSGYAFHCPPRSLRDGEHTVELRIRANSGREMAEVFQITVKRAEGQLDSTGIQRRMSRVEADLMSEVLADLKYRPLFQFILRQDGVVDTARLNATLNALRLQPYRDWTMMVLAGDDAAARNVRTAIDRVVPHLGERFSIVTPSNEKAWNAPIAHSADGRSSLYALLSPGDELGADAMLELAVASGRHDRAELIYGDEVRLSPVSNEREPFFKPDFSPDLIWSTNYIGRPWVATAALLARTGVTPARLKSEGEYDLVLRCSELAAAVHHIPKLLCDRASTALDSPDQEMAALEGMLRRRGIVADVLSTPIGGTWRVKREVASRGKVSIIIPTCGANGYIETCITSLRAKTTYPDYEIICVDNILDEKSAWKDWLRQQADKVIEIKDPFNWSKLNNRAVALANGEYLLFLNDDIEIVQNDWLDRLVEHAQRPDVAITGPQLLYRDGKVQHAGMFLSGNGIGRHAFRFAAKDDPCYFGLALTQRNVIAVTGACMLVKAATFEQLGRFDEAHEIVNNDLDFCLRAHRAGLLTVYTPYATLIHHELASRANLNDVYDMTHFDTAWKSTFTAGDPYFNPRLFRHADDFRPDDEPVQRVLPGAPLFHGEDIKRILVVKLDHIGDFVTALPPIRRLKMIFPQAKITVLASPASRAFMALETCIDEFIPFSFFHVRSQLGERELNADDYKALADELQPYRFDLAVDLRKHMSTRDVLKYTGARFLAGFDYLGQFPFLDIALDWDGDRTLQRKRSHIVDDLLALVNAIGRATETDRIIIQPGPRALPLGELPSDLRALFDRPVVAVHPGAGNITKQWPEAHFSALLDMLIERNGINVLLIGGPDEIEVADTVMKNVLHPDRIGSMAGQTSLSDLPGLLKNCALYIGNDSGPKHIAAAVGVPTIGIHSGVVDPVEWGPVGPNAIALRRNMTCSPCYLANAEDCPRALACLRMLEPNMVYEAADLLLRRVPSAKELTCDLPGESVALALEPRREAKVGKKGKVKRALHAAEIV